MKNLWRRARARPSRRQRHHPKNHPKSLQQRPPVVDQSLVAALSTGRGKMLRGMEKNPHGIDDLFLESVRASSKKLERLSKR